MKASTSLRSGTPPNPGEIQPGVLYTVSEAKRRLGFGDWAWRQLTRKGLEVIRTSNRAFVLGSDLINTLAKLKQ